MMENRDAFRGCPNLAGGHLPSAIRPGSRLESVVAIRVRDAAGRGRQRAGRAHHTVRLSRLPTGEWSPVGDGNVLHRGVAYTSRFGVDWAEDDQGNANKLGYDLPDMDGDGKSLSR